MDSKISKQINEIKGKYKNLKDDSFNAYLKVCHEEEKSKLFQTIKDYGYEWDNDSKCFHEITGVHLPIWDNVDKIIKKKYEPKFKVGDVVKLKSHELGKYTYEIIDIKDDYYVTNDGTLSFMYEDIWELESKKFDIGSLIPFESKVLVRNDNKQRWIPAFWGGKREDGYVTTFGWSKYCVPYEGNEHLLDKTDDCDEYYKTWE